MRQACQMKILCLPTLHPVQGQIQRFRMGGDVACHDASHHETYFVAGCPVLLASCGK